MLHTSTALGKEFARKSRVLLFWPAVNTAGFKAFRTLSDRVDFLLYCEGEPDTHMTTVDFEHIYYRNFSSPQALLAACRPDCILAFSLTSFSEIAINIVARAQGTPTYILHHGIYQQNGVELAELKKGIVTDTASNEKGRLNLHSVRFYFRAATAKLGALPVLLRYALLRRKHPVQTTRLKMKSALLLPDYFIQLSAHNAQLEKEMNGLTTDDCFVYIGHPFYDEFFAQLSSTSSRKPLVEAPYILLIDFPNSDRNLAYKTLGKKKKDNIYVKLSDMARLEGMKLVIKQHPGSYNDPAFYTDDNTVIVKDCDIASLIAHAAHSFGFYSSLLVPTLFANPSCTLIDIGVPFSLQNELQELGMVDVVTPETIPLRLKPRQKEITQAVQHVFVERYLKYTDGLSTDRLCSILTETPRRRKQAK